MSVDFTDITTINLIESDISAIGVNKRTNGYAGFGDTLKGNFKSSAHGDVLLFVRKTASPIIHIERAANLHLLGAESGASLPRGRSGKHKKAGYNPS